MAPSPRLNHLRIRVQRRESMNCSCYWLEVSALRVLLDDRLCLRGGLEITDWNALLGKSTGIRHFGQLDPVGLFVCMQYVKHLAECSTNSAQCVADFRRHRKLRQHLRLGAIEKGVIRGQQSHQ